MKKVLSLLLVLTMACSFMGVMGAATFADEGTAPVEEPAPAPAEAEEPVAAPAAAPEPDPVFEEIVLEELSAPVLMAAAAPLDGEGEEQTDLTSEGGDKTDPPAEGGDKIDPPAEGGDKIDPPAEGGDKIDPPAEGGDKTDPSDEGGDKTDPSDEGGDKTDPSDEGGDKTDSPAEGGAQLTADSFKEAQGLVGGQQYVITVRHGEGFHDVLTHAGGAVSSKSDVMMDQFDETMLWTATANDKGNIALVGGGLNLYYKSGFVNKDAKYNWKYSDGKLWYQAGGDTYYMTLPLTGSSLPKAQEYAIVLYTTGPEVGTASGSSSSSGSGSSSGSDSTDSSSSTGYADAKGRLGTGYAVLSIGGKYISFDRNELQTGDVTVGDDGTVTPSKGTYLVIQESADPKGYVMFVYDPPDEAEANMKFLQIGMNGVEFVSTKTGVWNIEPGKGGKLYFTDADGKVWYFAAPAASGAFNITDSKDKATDVVVYFGTTKPSGGGGGKPPSESESVDAAAPVFSVQPKAPHFVYFGSGYAAPEFTVTAALPEGSTATSVSLQWFVSGEPFGPPETTEGATATSTRAIGALQNKAVGVYPVYCKASCVIDGEEHSSNSYTVNFIVCNGVKANSVITFSDVHETWNNVGTAIYDTIIAENGLIPALIIATGDFNNNYLTGDVEEYYTKAVAEVMARIALQVGGIDTVWVSGNHDNGYAAQYTNWNEKANLGIVAEEYSNKSLGDGKELTGITGTGIIFDTRSEGYKENAESSRAIDSLIVIGVNYEDLLSAQQGQTGKSDGRYDSNACDYGDGTEENDSVYKHLETALDRVAADYHGELVVISTHAGLHSLKEDGGTSSDPKDYSITNSAAVVKLINSYAEKGIDILWLFGHDHSKGENEFVKNVGDTIHSVDHYDGSTAVTEAIELKFTYAHAGYITNTIGGKTVYSYITMDDTTITRDAKKADGEHTAVASAADDGSDALDISIKRTDKVVPKPTVGGNTKADQYTPSARIISAFAAKIPSGYPAANIAYYDVTLENGEIPSGGLALALPMPEGASINDVLVLHLPSGGEVETFSVEQGNLLLVNGELTVFADSLSPFAVVWKEAAPADPGTNPGGNPPAKPGTNPQAPGKGQQAPGKPGASPKTGDESNAVLWIVLFIVCAGTAAAVLPRKKHDK